MDEKAMNDLFAAVQEKTAAYLTARTAADAASTTADAALGELTAAQKSLDDALAQLRGDAPIGSGWNDPKQGKKG